MTKKLFMKNNLVILLLLLLSILSIFVGVNKLSIGDFLQTSSIEWNIIVTTRLPRTISLILAVATLALSGLLMQQLTQNKFTSLSTVGTMQSARLGLLVSFLFFQRNRSLTERHLL